MSYPGRLVLAAIDEALEAHDRHPTLFAAQLRRGRDCRQLAAAVSRYKRQRPTRGGRADRDEVERVPADWEELNARRREERFEKRKRAIDAERRERRAGMGALELHRHAVEREAAISTVASGSVEPSRGGSERAGPPAQQLLDDDPRWRETWAVIRARLERAHELLDEAEGLDRVAAITTLAGVEKDARVIREGEGLSPTAVVEKLGRDIAGSPETVRRIRRRLGRSALDGRLREVDS